MIQGKAQRPALLKTEEVMDPKISVTRRCKTLDGRQEMAYERLCRTNSADRGIVWRPRDERRITHSNDCQPGMLANLINSTERLNGPE